MGGEGTVYPSTHRIPWQWSSAGWAADRWPSAAVEIPGLLQFSVSNGGRKNMGDGNIWVIIISGSWCPRLLCDTIYISPGDTGCHVPPPWHNHPCSLLPRWMMYTSSVRSYLALSLHVQVQTLKGSVWAVFCRTQLMSTERGPCVLALNNIKEGPNVLWLINH